MAADSIHDFIIVGGGIAGSVLASRLHSRFPLLSILLIEAGPDVTRHPLITDERNAPLLVGSELDWNYSTVPQRHLNNRVCSNHAGKALGGGSAINQGGWIRGDANDYDRWASLVQDLKWSYNGFLPYFRKTEHYHKPKGDAKEHGHDGPIHTQSVSSTGRDYPLREPFRAAWAAVGVDHVADTNSGSPHGLGELVENRREGTRQLASTAYSLAGVQVMTETLVKRVLVEVQGVSKAATGVELADGRILSATKEIILSAGAYRTPQLLLLSGIGPADDLAAQSIIQTVDARYVGRNLHDHLSVAQWWKLRHPEAGLSLGSPKFNSPAFAKGVPMDWIVTQTVPREGLKKALAKDEGTVNDSHQLLSPARSHIEYLVVYAGMNHGEPIIPMDGSHITTTVAGLLPTSRGTVRLASTDPTTAPLIDPNYYATEADRYVMREGLRKMSEVIKDTAEGQAIVASETVAKGRTLLDSKVSDEDLDQLVRAYGKTLYHAAGSAAMGKVVDTNLNVYGIRGLRVVDASVIPEPIAGHYQACVYALAEQAADILAETHLPEGKTEAV